MATKSNTPKTGRLNEIVAYRRSQGGSVTGALAGGIKERLKEKFDPRQLINQKGLLTSLFPGLKTYQAKTAATEISKSSLQSASFDEIKPILESISINSKMTARNTMVLPALHRDVNVMRQNMVKLVKLKGGDARTKADMYFVKAKEREEKYERELRKERNKQSRIEKLKNEEEKKSKSFFGKIVSSIVKGLSVIVESIIKLGKAILVAFKFLAEIIGGVLITLGKAFLGALSSITSLIPNIKDVLKQILGFVSGGLVRAVIRTVIGRMISFLFSPGALFRIGFGLLGFFAAAFGLSLLPAARRQAEQLQKANMAEEDIYKQIREEAARGLKTGEYSELPTSSRRLEGDELERAKLLGMIDERAGKGSILGGSEGKPLTLNAGKELTELQKNILNDRFNSEILQEFNNKKRSLYKLNIPGFNDTHAFLLTKEQATEYGDKQREYLSVLRKIIQLKQSNIVDNYPKIQNLRSQLDMIKGEMLASVGDYVVEQINPQNDIQRAYLTNISNVMKGISPEFSEVYAETLTNKVMNSGIVKSIQENVKKEGELFINSLKLPEIGPAISSVSQSAQQNLSELRGNLESKIKEFYATNIIDKTYDNRRNSVVFKQPIVVNQESVVKAKQPMNQLGSPASAWNNDFIDKHFSDMIMNPLRNISY